MNSTNMLIFFPFCGTFTAAAIMVGEGDQQFDVLNGNGVGKSKLGVSRSDLTGELPVIWDPMRSW
ncbi:hypothetical protein TIFTF001_053496 [Ficus carica]|uniref:Uncharacterized protein n=1 Tax=Ficus carica TaxID=3494 RepID=A0AA88EF95_FICCA|nr:hypothetical protein TIFTF001_053493 [Ficus carica]GMN72019.1 hypothetical protein TIFTF001_053494 [Ficus carica]GMN72023.1 hypothetical protein TIFTF001_053495 [Ficus carica]GMN72030.1 hypothetical protein TIFTF001_053496 [Ficus carica]